MCKLEQQREKIEEGNSITRARISDKADINHSFKKLASFITDTVHYGEFWKQHINTYEYLLSNLTARLVLVDVCQASHGR